MDFIEVDGARLRAIRLRRGFSQEQLAAKSGYGVRTIRRLEQGRHRPQPRTLKDLADALGVTVDELSCSKATTRRNDPEPPVSPAAGERARERLNAPSEEAGRQGIWGVVRDAPVHERGDGRLIGVPRNVSQAFVGRLQEFAALESVLLAESGHVSVEGPPGVGKTELALQVAHQLKIQRRFTGGIFWIDAESPDLEAAWGISIADQWKGISGSAKRRCNEVLERIRQSSAPTLIILDNVSGWGLEKTPQPLPEGQHVRLLVTTQLRNLGGAQFEHVALDVLGAPDDQELLLRLAKRAVDPGMHELLGHLEGHALGLELAGAYLGAYPTESAQSYLRNVMADSEKVEARAASRTRYSRTVSQAFQATWARLSESARSAWSIAACFEPEPADVDLAFACGIGWDDFRVLEELHLIQPSPGGRWIMHRLTREFGRQSGHAVAMRAFVDGCATFASRLDRMNSVMFFGRNRVHVDAALASADAVLVPAQELEFRLWAGAVRSAFSPSSQRGRRDCERAVALAESMSLPEPLFRALEGLTVSTAWQGEWAQHEDLARRIDALAREHEHHVAHYAILASLTLGQAHFYAGRLLKALSFFEQGLLLHQSKRDRWEAILDPRSMVLAHAALANCLLGRPDRAAALGREAVAAAEMTGDPSILCTALLTTVATHRLRLEYDAIQGNAARAASIAEAHQMPFFSDIAQVAGVWASIMGGLSNHPEAELRSAEQSLARLENERFRAYRTVVLAKFAECYRALGMPEQARQKVEEGLKVASDKNDRFFEPELHRIRASLVSQAQAEQYLEKAWLLAESQGSVWLSLRASTDLVNLLQDQARCGPARARLRMSLSAVEGGEGLPDLERARRALEGASA